MGLIVFLEGEESRDEEPLLTPSTALHHCLSFHGWSWCLLSWAGQPSGWVLLEGESGSLSLPLSQEPWPHDNWEGTEVPLYLFISY